MHLIEFNKIIRAIDAVENKWTRKSASQVESYRLGAGMNICFSGEKAIIFGKIPFEFANIIYENFDGLSGITIDSNISTSLSPELHAVDDIFLKAMEYYNLEKRVIRRDFSYKSKLLKDASLEESLRKIDQKVDEECQELKKRPNEAKYLTTYEISSAEVLIKFLVIMQEYFLNKGITFIGNSFTYDELRKQVNEAVLQVVTPYIIPCETNPIVSSFVQAVNPFVNSGIELKDAEEYSKNVIISGASNWGTGFYDYCVMNISDKNGNTTSYERSNTLTKFGLHYTEEPGRVFEVMYQKSLEKRGTEILYVTHIYNGNALRVAFNITNGSLSFNGNDLVCQNSRQVMQIYADLQKATDLANGIVESLLKKSKAIRQSMPERVSNS